MARDATGIIVAATVPAVVGIVFFFLIMKFSSYLQFGVRTVDVGAVGVRAENQPSLFMAFAFVVLIYGGIVGFSCLSVNGIALNSVKAL